MQYQQQQQRRRGIQQCPHGMRAYNVGLQMDRRRSVAAWVDTWRIKMKCAFPGPRQLRVAVSVARSTPSRNNCNIRLLQNVFQLHNRLQPYIYDFNRVRCVF